MKIRIASFFVLLSYVSAFSQPFEQIALQNYIDVSGGKQNLKNLKSLVTISEVVYYENGYNKDGSVTSESTNKTKMYVNDRGHYRFESFSASGTYVVVFDGISMKETTAIGHVLYPSDETVNEYKRRVINFGEAWLAVNAEEIKYRGELQIDNVRYYIYDIIYLGFKMTYFIRKDDYRLAKITMFNGISETHFDDYKEVEGLLIAFKRTGFVNGKLEHVTTVLEAEVNKALAPSLFFVN